MSVHEQAEYHRHWWWPVGMSSRFGLAILDHGLATSLTCRLQLHAHLVFFPFHVQDVVGRRNPAVGWLQSAVGRQLFFVFLFTLPNAISLSNAGESRRRPSLPMIYAALPSLPMYN